MQYQLRYDNRKYSNNNDAEPYYLDVYVSKFWHLIKTMLKYRKSIRYIKIEFKERSNMGKGEMFKSDAKTGIMINNLALPPDVKCTCFKCRQFICRNCNVKSFTIKKGEIVQCKPI